MKFSPASPWAEVSEDGGYSVAIAKCGERFRYSACVLKPHQLLGTFDDIEAARECCRRDESQRAASLGGYTEVQSEVAK